MFKQIITLLAIIAYVNASCRDLTLNDCEAYVKPPFDQSKGLTLELCQLFCNEIYNETCKSFSFNTKDSTCELYDVLPLDFFDNCNVLGVDKETDVESCPSAAASDQCVVSQKITCPKSHYFQLFFSYLPMDFASMTQPCLKSTHLTCTGVG